MKNKLVVIIIPIHNRINITIEGLNSLFRALEHWRNHNNKSYLKYKIVVIDDGSIDGSYEYVKETYSAIKLIKGSGDLWWSGAINIGAKYSIEKLNADYVLLLNDDIELCKDYFIALENLLKSKPNVIVGSSIYERKTHDTWSSLKSFNQITGTSKTIRNDQKGKIKWVTGMGVLIPTAVIDKIGYWDSKNFPQYFGDADFVIRASLNGFIVIISEDLIIYNKTEYSSYIGYNLKSFIKSIRKKNIGSRYNYFIRWKFYRKHCSGPLFIFTFTFFYIKYMFKILKSK